MKYIIHRGITSNKIEENSYKSIKFAIKDYLSSGVEFDVRLTKDDKIVLAHDCYIKFNTIEKANYLDIIKHKYLTTLDKILTIDTDKILLIDIKVNNNYKRFGDVLIKYLDNCNRNIYLCSFNKNIIKYLRKKSKYKLACILFKYRKNNGDFVMVNYKGISNNKIKNINNKEIFLWTIKNSNDLNYAKDKFSNLENYYLIIDKKE